MSVDLLLLYASFLSETIGERKDLKIRGKGGGDSKKDSQKLKKGVQ